MIDLTDVIAYLSHLFLGGPDPGCLEAADFDDSGILDLTDAVASLAYQYLAGPPPAAPFSGCGRDPSPGGLGCHPAGPCR